MIDFDRNGNPQPIGLTELKFADFKVIFVDKFETSKTRAEIFKNYSRFLDDFKKEIAQEFKNWVNGSYTTTKENPNDIDVVSVVKHDENLNLKTHILNKFLQKGGSKDKYFVDGYFIPVYPEDDPRFAITQEMTTYWLNWFGKNRQGESKGVIQLSFS